jgi:ATP-dependent helicase/nuclease subunit A
LAREFNEAFTEAKRELGAVDFHDLEQYTLRLLWDTKANQPTRIARQWRQKLRFLFVDEYQDINAAQDKIIEALSREGAQANRFLVGDVKQSIYRFRLAEPKIFQGYAETWRNGKGQAIPLVENFRSREGILNFINSLFGLVMQPEIGGVRYDEQAQLRFGAREERRGLSAAADSAPCVELHLRLKGGAQQPERGEETAEALAEVADLEEADKEARLVALRLRELRAQQRPVWDEKAKRFRPVQWSDMAVLLRAPTNKAESYAKEFSRLNVPLLVARGGFYESMGVSDLLSLLRLLDNPLQDLPLLAVMHSPLVGLTLDELAIIRLTAAKAPFWTALVRFEERAPRQVDALCAPEPQGKGGPLTPALSPSEVPTGRDFSPRENQRQLSGKPKLMGRDGAKSEATPQARPNPGDASPITNHAETLLKVRTFLERFARWRRLARQVSLSRCLEAVLSETHYADWLLTQPRGEQRHANVQRLLSLTQQFDQFQRQGLFRFLRFIQAQEVAETEPEVAPVTEGEAVRLMSIHQSKGLEFPVVVVADLGKAFNVSDLRAEVILDEEYGLCPQIKPPHSGSRYPSLPYWLARRRQHREMLGEELRLLYVAMTRARDLLILSGSVSEKRFEQIWKGDGEAGAGALLSARSYADWLGCWFSRNAGSGAAATAGGENAFLHWEMHDDTKLIEPGADAALAEEPAGPALAEDPGLWEKLQQRLSWVYPFMAATRRPAKTSVTALRRRAAVQADEEAAPLLEVRSQKSEVRGQKRELGTRSTQDRSRATGADFGSAHHVFLQLVSLERAGSVEELKREAERLERQGALTPEEVALLDFKGLAGFWQSDLGRKVQAQAQFVRRELAFTARFSPKELVRLTGEPSEPTLEEEFVVVQGVADLAVLLPQELWLIDFKTDAVGPNGLADKVKSYEPQLKLYALALSQIYRRPVSQCWLYFLTSQTAAPIKPD